MSRRRAADNQPESVAHKSFTFDTKTGAISMGTSDVVDFRMEQGEDIEASATTAGVQNLSLQRAPASPDSGPMSTMTNREAQALMFSTSAPMSYANVVKKSTSRDKARVVAWEIIRDFGGTLGGTCPSE
jgi:hypothetical protein